MSEVTLWLDWVASTFWLRAQISEPVSIPFGFLALAIPLLPVSLVTTLTAPFP